MAKKEKKQNPDRLPIGRFLAFRAGNFAMAANYMIMGFVQIYCTNTLLMDPLLVGTVLLVTKLFDAFGELYCGWIVDNSKVGKFGRTRKFDLMMIGQWGCTILLFSVPTSFSMPIKIAYVFTMYMLIQSVFQSLVQAANQPRLFAGFASKQVVLKVQSYGGVIGMMLSIAFNVGFPMLMKRMATSPAGWTQLMLTVCIPLCLIGLTRYFFVDEKYETIDREREEKIKLSDMINVAKNNKYIWIVGGLGLLLQIVPGLGVNTYFFQDVIGDIGKMGTISMMGIVLLPVMLFVPMLTKKFTVAQLIAAGAFVGVFGGILAFFAGSNMTLILAAAVLTGVAVIAPPYMSAVMIEDCATYDVYNGRPKMDATLASITNFAGNLGTGIGGFIAGAALKMFGYVGGAATQSASALLGLRVLYGLVPAVVYLLMALLALSFNLEKQIPAMQAEIAARAEVK